MPVRLAMNPPDPILDQLLLAVRATKRRRQWRRGAVAMASVIAATCFLLPRHRDPTAPLVESPPPAPAVAPAESSLAVLVWHGDTPLFEKMDPDELGSVELAFGLEPVIAYPDEPWGELPN